MNFQITLFFLIVFSIVASNCSIKSLETSSLKNINLIAIETPKDKYNILFRESLIRSLSPNKDYPIKYILRTSISYDDNDTLAISGLKPLNETSGVASYELLNIKDYSLIKKGSIKKSIISASVTSLYTRDINKVFIKERLVKYFAIKIKNILILSIRDIN